MRIYTRAGDLSFKLFNFPDGQPHFELLTDPVEDSFHEATIETAIRNPTELFQTLLVADTLRNVGYSCALDIRYLMGARMDRAIDCHQPFTLQRVAQQINSGGFSKVRVLDAHSDATCRLIRNCTNVLPFAAFGQARSCSPDIFVIPDKGAISRCEKLFGFSDYLQVMSCGKRRDPQTGALAGFEILSGENYVDRGRSICMLVDDLCDGGGTFVGLAKELRKAGANKVFLYITHGIFSKGLPLEGIDRVFTTNSYLTDDQAVRLWPYRISVRDCLTVIPVRMQDLR